MSDDTRPHLELGISSLTREKLLERMFTQLRRDVPDVAVAPELVDPAMRILFRALSAELEEVYQSIDRVGDHAFEALLQRLLVVPRGPRPAQSVAYFEVLDPGREVGPATALECTVKRIGEGGKPVDVPLDFRPCFTARLGEYEVVAIARVAASGEAVLEHYPIPSREPQQRRTETWPANKCGRPHLMFCLEARDLRRRDLRPAVFIDGPREAVRSVLWGNWTRVGAPDAHAPWTPATVPDRISTDDPIGVLTYRTDREHDWGVYADQFVRLACADDAGVEPELLRESGRSLGGDARRWWWDIELAGDPEQDLSAVRFYANCLPIENRQIQSKDEIVPDLARKGIVLPVAFDTLAAIESVVDLGTSHEFQRADDPDALSADRTYILRRGPDDRSVAVYMRGAAVGRQSARIEVRYSTNSGANANDIGPNLITRFKTPEPGLLRASNLTSTVGGAAARSVSGVEEEIRSALRHHGRAVAVQDYRDLAMSLGQPYVLGVEVRAGVRVTPKGAERCVDVLATVSDTFISDLERQAVRDELARRLALRAPVGTPVRVTFVGPQGPG